MWNIEPALAQKCEEAVEKSGLAPKDTATPERVAAVAVDDSDDETAKLTKEALWQQIFTISQL